MVSTYFPGMFLAEFKISLLFVDEFKAYQAAEKVFGLSLRTK